MTKKEKKVIFILVGIMLAILLLVVIWKGVTKKENKVEKQTTSSKTSEVNEEKYVTSLESGSKINNSSEFNKTKKYKDIEISNVQFTYQEGKSVLLADVKNTASTKHESEIVKITIIGENNQVIEELSPVLPKMEPGESKKLNLTISGVDKVNAKDFKIEEK